MYHTSENYTAGEHEIQLNVGGFATGMYFISVDAGEAPVVRKLLIQR
jgi:hypothetical protein